MDIFPDYEFFNQLIQTKLFTNLYKILIALGIAGLSGIFAGLIRSKFKITVQKTTIKIDDLFFEHKIDKSMLFLLMIFVFNLSFSFLGVSLKWVDKGVQILTVIAIIRLIFRILSWTDAIYQKNSVAKRLPIKGIIQLSKLIFCGIAAVLVISLLLDKSLIVLLSGIGALSAVILLIFKDTISNFVNGIQITLSRTIEIGDWISIPEKNIDGEVTDISLYFIKVQNWDKTLSIVQLSQIINAPIQNWRGMYEAKSRRIQRSLFLNANQVRFADEALINQLKKVKLLEGFFEERIAEIKQFIGIDENQDHPANHRTFTNIGIFRMYILYYLKNSNLINHELTLMVRQLQSTVQGIPLEVYAFAGTVDWVEYERIQCDIFDHLFAVCRYFNLEIYQAPSRDDFRLLAGETVNTNLLKKSDVETAKIPEAPKSSKSP